MPAFAHAFGADSPAAGPADAPARGSPMDEVHELVDLVAPTRLPVLLLGETGTGKEILAEAIHRRSPRASKAFVCLNGAALPEPLLESAKGTGGSGGAGST